MHEYSEEINLLRANRLQVENQVSQRDLLLNNFERDTAELQRQLEISKNENRELENKLIEEQEIQADLRTALNNAKIENEQSNIAFNSEINHLKSQTSLQNDETV